jgi:hypothetical protein
MTRRIVFADISLNLDNHSARAHTATIVHEDFAEEVSGDDERGAIVKRSGELHR